MRILVYDDNPDYGGHQTMACHGIEALAADPQIKVVCIFNPHNKRLAHRVAGISNVQILEAPCATRCFQGLRNQIDRQGIRALKKKFQSLEPDLVLCIQGDIEQSSQAALAARLAGIECISYIAIPHRMADMGAKLGALRDRTNQYLFNQPHRYIAVSESMKQLLIDRGVTQPIAIVPNGIPTPPKASSHIPHSTSHKTIGLLGRVEFNQKRQDFMVKAFCNHPEAFHDCRLIIAGNGPDEGKLRQLVSGKENISLLPWQDDAEAFYEKIDLLMLPSRYEGVPLVMLEALARGIPVVGSRRDGMKEVLPEAWTFEPENPEALAKTFSAVRETWQDDMANLQQKILAEHSLETFKTNFHRALCSGHPTGSATNL